MEKTYEPESMWLISPEPGLIHPLFFAQAPDPSRVYVDLGCSHPTNKSLTAFVRDLGWSGVAIDANEAYRQEWEQAGFKKHFVRAVLSNKPTVRFAYHENSFTSRISPSTATDHPERWGINYVQEEETADLNDVLSYYGIAAIDLLTIDLEGAEFDVLQTLDFEKHTPSFIIAEYDTAGVGIDCRVCNFLLGKGYEVIQQFPSNLIYRRK